MKSLVQQVVTIEMAQFVTDDVLDLFGGQSMQNLSIQVDAVQRTEETAESQMERACVKSLVGCDGST